MVRQAKEGKASSTEEGEKQMCNESEERTTVTTNERGAILVQLDFVKSILTINPCMV